MNMHKNARLTPSGRLLLVRRVLAGWRVKEAAEALGVSQRTAFRWLGRHRSGAPLCDRSSAPHHCAHRLSPAVVDQIGQLRRQRLTGPAIAGRLGLARSTVGAVLRRSGLGRLSQLDAKPAIVRYERQNPGELIHLDIKKLGRFNTVGHRITGDRRKGVSRGAGFDFLHVAIDDASRLAFTEVLPSEGQTDTTAFLERALAWFSKCGVLAQRVMTDNGSAYRSKRFADALRLAGLRHVRTRPYTPKTNGKAERFIQTTLREWAYAAAYPSSEHRRCAIAPWTDAYNRTRPHSALGGISPWQRLNNLLGNDI